MRAHSRRRAGTVAAVAWVALAGMPLRAQVRGTVTNATTGEPAPGVALTLSTFSGGMRPVEEARSGPDGSFAFTKPLPEVPPGQPFRGAIRAEHEGIGYTEILGSDTAGDGDVRITVYSVQETGIPPPQVRVVLFQPEQGRLQVHELYQIVNDSDSPVTYSSEEGTLRFHLPEAAGGQVDVSGTGPAGMPLRSSALPAGDPGTYKVDFPLKPGDNRIDLSYSVPHEDGGEFLVRSVYPGMQTRVAAPEGVEVSGEGLSPLGQEPSTRASTYLLADAGEAALSIRGEGRLPSGSPSGGSGQADISIQPAPVASELFWLVGLSALILGAGFLHLLKSEHPTGRGAPSEERG